MKPTNKNVLLLCLTSFLALLAGHFAIASERIPVHDTAVLRGTVKDQSNHPVSHVKIRLVEQETNEVSTSSTDRQGRFLISSNYKGQISLQFDPGFRSGLATAIFDHLPAQEDRQLIVHLPQGFAVSGKVTAAGHGLKDLIVRITPTNPENVHEQIYGGATTRTRSGGKFQVILLPGKKQLTVINSHHAGLPSRITRQITVADEIQLLDIDMTPPGK